MLKSNGSYNLSKLSKHLTIPLSESLVSQVGFVTLFINNFMGWGLAYIAISISFEPMICGHTKLKKDLQQIKELDSCRKEYYAQWDMGSRLLLSAL